MKRIAVAIITFNEEKNIREALESVAWADEIILVDAFSGDKTVDLARPYTDKIFQRSWSGYVDQKNFALQKATHDWILSIDADERVSPQLREEILNWKTLDTQEAGYQIPRRSFFLGKWIRHTGWYPDYQLRLFDRTKGKWQGGRVHESVNVTGKIGRLRGELLHYSYRSMSDYLKRLDRYSDLAARDYYDKNKKVNLLTLVFAPFLEFIKNYLIKQGFRDGYPGFVISACAAISVFFKYARLWELKETARRESAAGEKQAVPSILFIDTERGWRGGQQQLLALMLGLREQGYRVSLAAQTGSPLESRARQERFRVYPTNVRNEIDVLGLFQLYKVFKSTPFHIVHYNTPKPILFGTLLSKLMNVPNRVISRCVNFPLKRGLSRIKYTWGVDKIIAVSHDIKNTLVRHGIPSRLIEVIHEGIDLDALDRYEPAQAACLDPSLTQVGTVGHLSAEKGERFLIEAAAELCERYEQLRVVIVGEGELRPELEGLARSLRLHEKVIFTGFREDFFSLIKSFKVFVLPSLSEGFGVVILYAMAASLPVVATNVGGVPEIVQDRITGLLVPAGDSKELARAIAYLLDHPEQARAMGEAGRRRLEAYFSLKTKIDRTIDVYKSLLNGSR